jgi:hypothetical protein
VFAPEPHRVRPRPGEVSGAPVNASSRALFSQRLEQAFEGQAPAAPGTE